VSVKTWDVLDRETGEVALEELRFWEFEEDPRDWMNDDEVAWCRETGEVVYR